MDNTTPPVPAGSDDRTPAASGSEPVQEIRSLVTQCIEALEQGEQDPVTRVCATRTDLAPAVRRRLQQLAARGLLPNLQAALPERIGAYRILAELGSGGMGSVYLAEQDVPVRRRVALKVIKLGMDTQEVVARFAAERQALALMSHPHIAQVFDAGATPEGRPFFAMEFVEGETITKYADRRRLSAATRLELFAMVCRAVQHAHDKGVIHRDLKPSNVLVAEHTGKHMPKIIDFGIAKATGPGAEGIARTQADQVLGTPEYMSPEQACTGGLDVDTRTDVYSLGVLLYEILCGEVPFASGRLRRATRAEFERILLEEAPTSPSTRVFAASPDVARARGSDPRSLGRAIRGEIDWIVLKALDKNRERRYPSPLAFAEDVERFLRGDPVLAGPPALSYRLRKFVRRHRAPVFASIAVFVALVAGLVVSLAALADAFAARKKESLAHTDTRDFYGLARSAVEDMLVAVGSERLRFVPQADPVRRELLEKAMHFYEALQARHPVDPELRAEIVFARQKVGAIQRELGELRESEKTLRDALEGLAAIADQLPRPGSAIWRRAVIENDLAITVGRDGRSREAKEIWQSALRRMESLDSVPGGSELRDPAQEAAIWNNIAIETEDDAHARLDAMDHAVACLQLAVAAKPDSVELRARLWQCRSGRSDALLRAGDPAAAATAAEAAVAGLRTLCADTSRFDARSVLAIALQNLSQVRLRTRELPAAEVAVREACDTLAALVADHPDIAVHADAHAGALHRLADIVAESDLPRALPLYSDAVAARERVAQRYPQSRYFRMRLVRIQVNQGGALATAAKSDRARLAEATDVFRSALSTIDALLTEAPDDADVVATNATVHSALGTVLDLGGDAAAATEFEQARATLQALVARSPRHVEGLAQLAAATNSLLWSRMRVGRLAEALTLADEGAQSARSALEVAPGRPDVSRTLTQIVVRRAAIQARNGDDRADARGAVELLETPGLAPSSQEDAARLLGFHWKSLPDDARRSRALDRAIDALRGRVTTRLRPEAVAGSPASIDGTIELACSLADLMQARNATAEARRVLEEVAGVARKSPALAIGPARILWLALGSAQLAEHAVDEAAATAQDLATRFADDGESHWVAAVLLARVAQAGSSAGSRSGEGAVQHLVRAKELGYSFPVDLRQSPDFVALHDVGGFAEIAAGR